ncbi:hypothetical protein AU193_11665 [Mycobacterium sp. GA-1285]|nr:hypothetical protein AU193_11665 [Mycobacterium sp. GA-1285]
MRAFYIKHSDGGVLGVKGSEVVDDDLERAFRQSYSLGQRWAPMEVFPLAEQKLGLAVHGSEALDEAKIAASFQEKYVRQFGELANTPMHLAVYRFPEEVVDKYFDILDRYASDRTRHLSRLLAEDGLAAYVYFFPHLPVRLAHVVPPQLGDSGIFDAATRDGVLSAQYGYDARSATHSYFSLAGRMLAIGYFPLSMASYGVGYCTSAQNVTLRGGMVDVDSLYPFEKVKSDWEFSMTFLTTMSTICATAKVLLFSPMPNIRFEFDDPSAISVLLTDFVWNRIRQEVAACAEMGIELDARLDEMLSQPSTEKISNLLAKMYPQRQDFFLATHLVSGYDNRGWD